MDAKTLFSIIRHVQIKTFEKDEIIIATKASKKEVILIRKGLVRCFKGNKRYEEETTFQLYAENDLFGNIHAIAFNEPSEFTYQALENTKAYIIDFNQISKKTQFDRGVLGKKLIRQSFSRVESLIFFSPEERYLKYLKDNPSIVNRAPDKYIAHVLGITPFSLSRIRKRLSDQKK